MRASIPTEIETMFVVFLLAVVSPLPVQGSCQLQPVDNLLTVAYHVRPEGRETDVPVGGVVEEVRGGEEGRNEHLLFWKGRGRSKVGMTFLHGPE